MRHRKLLFAAAAALSLTGSAPAYGADSCPNAEVRAQQRAEFLPDCRAYEQVSAVDKGGQSVDVGNNVGITRAAQDGNAFLYVSWGNFGDAEGGMPLSYRASRTAEGWRSEAVAPRPRHPNPYVPGRTALWLQTSSDLSSGYTLTKDAFDLTDISTDPFGNFDVYRTGPGQYTELISRGNGGERTGPDGDAAFAVHMPSKLLQSVSRDGRHLVFRADSHLVPGDADRPDGLGISDVYDRADGVTHLVNLDSDEELLNACGSVPGNGFSAQDRAISDDGARIVFRAPMPAGPSSEPDCALPPQVYVRVNHEETVQASRSQRTDCATQEPCDGVPDPDPTGPRAATFEGASADGRYVFFSSEEMLTDDATSGDFITQGGLYRYDVEEGDLELVQDGVALLGAGLVTKVLRTSADGSTVYYMSLGAYAPGAILGDLNLYARRGDETKLVATSPNSSFGTQMADGDEGVRQAMVTEDGRHFVFATTVVLGPFNHAGQRAVYRFEFDTGELVCVSCDPAGQRPADSQVTSSATLAGMHDQSPAISSDGRVVVFETGDRLVSRDVNAARDVYGYQDGSLALISSGQGDTNSELVGMDPEGESVFFLTGDGLVGSDRDGNVDAYVARTAGGFFEQDAVRETECAGDSCQGAPSTTGAEQLAGSLTFRGAGDLNEPARVRMSVAHVGGRGRTARLRVRVSRGGRIAVSGRSVKGSRRRASGAAVYVIPVVLSNAALRRLRAKSVLGVTVTVRFRPTSGPAASKTVRLTFRSGKSESRSSRRANVASTTSREDR